MARRLSALAVGLSAALFLGCEAEPSGGQGGEQRRGSMVFERIGVIESPYTLEVRPPRQGRTAPDVESRIRIDDRFAAGLQDLETFSHVVVLWAFDRSTRWSPLVRTPWEKERHGVFATRSPNRPNPIGMTVVELVRREGSVLVVKGLDAFDGTPVLDLKPYIPSVDSIPDAGGGWRGDRETGGEAAGRR